MRNLLDPDQMLSPGRIRTATIVLTFFLAAAAGLMTLTALWTLLSSFKLGAALFQFVFGVGAPLAVWIIVRVLSEMLLAQHRLNDRLSVIAEQLSEQRVDPIVEPVREPVAPVAEPKVGDVEAAEADVEIVQEEEPKPKRRRKSAAEKDDS